jgi:hypothetical protein
MKIAGASGIVSCAPLTSLQPRRTAALQASPVATTAARRRNKPGCNRDADCSAATKRVATT